MRIYLIGMGVLGLTFAQFLQQAQDPYQFRIIANEKRQKHLRPDQVSLNGVAQYYNFVSPEQAEAADLILIACKSFALESVLRDIQKAVQPGSIIMSWLNGISSEERIAERYPEARIVYAVAQGMDGVRDGYHLKYQNTGQICFGKMPGQGAEIDSAIQDVKTLFDAVAFPYTVVDDMQHHLWGKFMLNCGLNQTVAFFKGNYGTCQSDPQAKAMMLAAFREVIAIAEKENVNLSEDDISYWVGVLNTLNPEGMPSMRQDQRDGRPMETELFAGTVLKLAEKHALDAPVNAKFYEHLTCAKS